MGKGLLSWWRRHIVTRGLAGVALFAVPVAVAALIGFGTSLSGVAGGLSALTNGPDAVPASAPKGPKTLNRAVAALAAKRTSAQAVSRGRGSSSSPTTSAVGGGSAGSGIGSTGTAVTGSSGGGSTSGSSSPTSTPQAPSVNLPGGGSGGAAGQAIDNVNGTVNNVVGGVNNTVNGLLGK